jgi:hypothetical protein
MTMFFFRAGGLFGIALCQRNRIRGLILASGERALVSSCSTLLLTCVGSLVIIPVIGSQMDERFAGAVCCWCFLSFEAVFYDGFESVPWFSNEHLEKCRAIFVIADSVGVRNSESCGDAVFLVAC